MIATVLTWIASTRMGRSLAAAGAVLLAVAVIFLKGRSVGGADARRKAEEIDHEGANQTRARVDAALADDAADGRSAAARLREAGRLRD
jgi:drug/metabolite transporter superfamily protein YnfA